MQPPSKKGLQVQGFNQANPRVCFPNMGSIRGCVYGEIEFLRIWRINIRLYGFIQSLSVLSTEKSRAKGWNREWDWSTTKKEEKKAQIMTSYLNVRVNMPTLGVTCTSFLIAHALLHSGACCPGRGGSIWLWCFTRQRAPMILCRSNSFLPRPSDWLAMYGAQNMGRSAGPELNSHLASLSFMPNLVFDVTTFAPVSSFRMVHGDGNSILIDPNIVRLSF